MQEKTVGTKKLDRHIFFSDVLKFPNKQYCSYKPYTEDKTLKIIHNTPKLIKDVFRKF